MLQVHTYLNTYAADRRASLPSGDLQRVNHLYSAACDVKLEEAKQGGDADLDRYIEIQRPASSYGTNPATLHYAVMVAGIRLVWHKHANFRLQLIHQQLMSIHVVHICAYTFLQLLSLHAALRVSGFTPCCNHQKCCTWAVTVCIVLQLPAGSCRAGQKPVDPVQHAPHAAGPAPLYCLPALASTHTVVKTCPV